MIRLVKPGEQFPDLIHHGDLLPLGTTVRIGHRNGAVYEQQAPRTWVDPSGGAPMDAYYLNGPNWLDRPVDMTEVEIPLESVEAFRWRMRDSALGAAERSGIHINPIIEMCSAFGAGTARFTEGGIVSSNVDIQQLPIGTVLYSGHPDVPSQMTVFEKKGHALTRILGTRDRQPGVPMTIYSIPGYTVPEPEVIADDDTLTRIALRVFRVGRAAQKNNGWCGVFNTCMTGVGITEQVLAKIGATTKGPGDTLDREQIALLPEGSILWWPWRSGQAFAVYIRDDSARGTSKTRRLFGWNDDGSNTHGHMHVVQTPDEPMAWRINGTMAQHLPDGVTLRVNGSNQVMSEGVRRHLVSYYDYAVQAWPVDAPVAEEVAL